MLRSDVDAPNAILFFILTMPIIIYSSFPCDPDILGKMRQIIDYYQLCQNEHKAILQRVQFRRLEHHRRGICACLTPGLYS
ncbi:hypothetical protein HYPSUDRAFT_919617 [Hypholoma sublateritium FD-334 SS-4]|uniref:Uncharacterized protein n=1 Tax=Hypholoma sublateritium (strain FD-334 SS-4) TaxID=945553 RepID=A0A0D2NPG4_HYPSF|nr:hypothetical protein HYPSUDRAFT_919617 [Hypholoma sublateritium FD-334 SS-4]